MCFLDSFWIISYKCQKQNVSFYFPQTLTMKYFSTSSLGVIKKNQKIRIFRTIKFRFPEQYECFDFMEPIDVFKNISLSKVKEHIEKHF